MSTATNPFQDRIEYIRADYERAGLAGSLADNLLGQFVDDYSEQFPFILELIQNAVDSAPAGKRVKIRFRLEEESLEPASVMSRNGGDTVRLTPAESEWAAQAGSDCHVVRVYAVDDSGPDATPEDRLIVIDDPLSMLNNGSIVIVFTGSLPGAYKVCVRQIGPRS